MGDWCLYGCRPKRRGPGGRSGSSGPDLLGNWALVEADFQREYGIDIGGAICAMSWRRFSVLLRGLGPNSSFVAQAQAAGPQPIEDPKEAEEAVRRVWASSRQRG